MSRALRLIPGGRTRTDAEEILHDLRGPLTIIRGQCHAISRAGHDDAAVMERLALIDAEVDRIVAGIDRVRATLHGGGGGPQVQAVALNALLRELARRHDGVCMERGVTLMVGLLPDERFVTGDPGALERMLDNLVRNAIAHAPVDTTVVVDVVERGGRPVVRVRDHGAGVPAANRRRVFRRGTSGDPSRGWGLGLPIAQRIARDHGSEITLDPTATGALFSVALGSAGGPRYGARS
jgi:signal transduction histidine kinase